MGSSKGSRVRQTGNFMRARYLGALVWLVAGFGPLSAEVEAQSGASNGSGQQQWRRLFSEDLKQIKDRRAAARKGAFAVDKPKDNTVGVSAPQVDYSADGKTVSASGGVVVSRGGVQVEAEEGTVNLESNEASFSGGLLVSSPQGSLAAEKGVVDLDKEVGVFENIAFSYDEGAYRIEAQRAAKLSETEYELVRSTMTSCDCREGDVPWSLYGRKVTITQGGYAHTRDLLLKVRGVPILYSPYFIFPVKTDRAAGLLVPQLGLSQRDGFRFWQPIFLPIDGSTDLTVTPFVETESRYGGSVRVRKEFSLRHSVRSKVVYSNESWREGSLRGLRVPTGVLPDIGNNRLGLMYAENWRSEDDALVPTSFNTDIRYTSDDEFLREIQDPEIGLATTIYQPSSMLLQSYFGSSVTASLGAEYNQIIDFDIKENDDAVFQRLPEASLAGSYRLNPFGTNPLGLKIILGGSGTVTSFNRAAGYDGTRTHIAPTVTVPFHVRNYMYGNVAVTGYDTFYSLQNVAATDPFSTSENRRTGAVQSTVGTALEKTLAVSPDGFWHFLTGLGAESASREISKIKHTIEPFVRYTFVPDVSQDALPLFDSIDRIRQRSLFTLGLDSSVFGKFESRRASSATIPELVPRTSDLPELGYNEGIPEMFLDGAGATSYRTRTGRQGDVRELVTFSLKETYDYAEEQEDNDPTRKPFSDIWTAVGLNPTNYVTVAAFSNTNPYSGSLTSWGTTLSTRDDRGDRLSGTYSFVDPVDLRSSGGVNPDRIDQVVGNAELVLTDRLKLGYYTRYDIVASDAIEQAVALRYVSSCNCWHVDLGMSETTNPDNQRVTVRFALTGLGDLAQDWMYRNASTMMQ